MYDVRCTMHTYNLSAQRNKQDSNNNNSNNARTPNICRETPCAILCVWMCRIDEIRSDVQWAIFNVSLRSFMVLTIRKQKCVCFWLHESRISRFAAGEIYANEASKRSDGHKQPTLGLDDVHTTSTFRIGRLLFLVRCCFFFFFFRWVVAIAAHTHFSADIFLRTLPNYRLYGYNDLNWT